MNISRLYNRSVRLITSSFSEWKIINNENLSVRELKRSVVIPYGILIAAFTFVGTLFTYLHSPIYSYFYLFVNALIKFGIVYYYIVISSWIIFRLAVNLDESNRKRNIFALIAYSNIPFFILLAISSLLPPLMIIMILSAYSLLLFWRGIPALLSIPAERKKHFLLISSLLSVTVYIILSQILTLLYTALTKEFTTFGN